MSTVNKTKNSLYNSVTSLLLTLVNGLCNLIVTRKLIGVYGSDFNGLNSTATQFITILLVIEGGFAIAANVALFEPLSANDPKGVSSIFNAVKTKFKRIGLVFSAAGLIGAVLFSLLIKTTLPFEICLCVFSMLVFSTGFGLFYATKYKVLLQSDQKEYVINIVTIVTYLLSYSFMYVAIVMNWHMLILRLIVMFFALFNSLLIGFYCRKKYSYLDGRVAPDFEAIKGTNDVFIQKIVGVIYYAAPILFISSIVSTAVASVYAVYNMVLTLIKSAEHSIINAPRMSLGRLVSEKGLDSSDFKKVFDEYECCTFVSISLFISVTAVMIMPFVKLYAINFTDVSYINWFMAVILILTCYIECIHIPAGNLLNMAGKFKQGKIIQLIGGGVLVVSILFGGLFFGINGIIVAVLLTAVVLAICEIGYVRLKVVKNDNVAFLKNFVTNTALCVTLSLLELMIPLKVDNFIMFFAYAFAFFAGNAVIIVIANLVLNKEIFISVIKRFARLFKRRQKV